MLIWVKIWTIFILMMPWQQKKIGYRNISYILVWGVFWATWTEWVPFSPASLCPVSAPALFLERSRQQRAAGIKQLSLSCHGFWPSPPKQSQLFPCRTHNQSNHVTLFQSQQTKVSSHNWEGWGLIGMQGTGAKTIQSMGLTASEHSLDYIISLSQDVLITTGLWDLSQRLWDLSLQKQIYLLYCLYEFSFCWKTVTAWLCLPKYRFLLGNH